MPRSFASSGGSGRLERTCRGDGGGQKSRLETETPKLKGGKKKKKRHRANGRRGFVARYRSSRSR